MGIVGVVFLVVFAIAAFLIIALVLLQDEQGEGFGGLFGGGGAATPFGTGGNNVLVRATTVLGVLFMVSSLVVAISYKTGSDDNVIIESRREAGLGQDWFMEVPAETAAEEPVESSAE